MSTLRRTLCEEHGILGTMHSFQDSFEHRNKTCKPILVMMMMTTTTTAGEWDDDDDDDEEEEEEEGV